MITDDCTMNRVPIFSSKVSSPRRRESIDVSGTHVDLILACDTQGTLNGRSLVTSLDYLIPPTITRPLLSSYRCSPGEQIHFLVEYYSSSMPCHCIWHVQHTHQPESKPVQNGSIVNTDSSSILIIESIARALQGIYTFYVENIHGRALTRTKMVVNSPSDEQGKSISSLFHVDQLDGEMFLACSVSLDELWDKQTDLDESQNGAEALQHANDSEHPYASIIQVASPAELLDYENWKDSIRNGTGDDVQLHQNGVIPN
jgi:hypothetical protein